MHVAHVLRQQPGAQQVDGWSAQEPQMRAYLVRPTCCTSWRLTSYSPSQP